MNRKNSFLAAIMALITSLLGGLDFGPVDGGFSAQAWAKEFKTTAKQAMLVDADTGTILFMHNADTPIEPASLAKMMTLETVFHLLEKKELSLSQQFKVSEYAWRTGGAPSGWATMFAKLNSEVPVEVMLQAIAVRATNDSCIILAEGIGGSDAGFARMMNERAKAIGMTESNFVNSTGQPAEGEVTTIRDMVKLARHLVETYPQYYSYFSLPSFLWNKIEQRNHNPLLKGSGGVDGIMMGYSEKEGYLMVASSDRNGQRLIAAMSGVKEEKVRNEEIAAILDWGYTNFKKSTVFKENEIVGYARVYGGAKRKVALIGNGNTGVYFPVDEKNDRTARIKYTGPILPPVKKGDQVAVLQIRRDKAVLQEVPLYAAEDVERGDLKRRAIDGLQEMTIRLFQMIPYRINWDELKIEHV